MSELKNQFSWSRSRDNAFQDCRRRYWLHYYGSWGGWERDAPTSVRQAYLLKQVASRHQWVGQEVHERVRMCLKMLKAGQTPELEMQMDSLVDTMRRRFKESRKGEWVHNPKRILRLFEHEYAFTIRDEKWVELREHAKDCLRGFFESPYFELAKSLPTDRWLAVDDDEVLYADTGTCESKGPMPEILGVTADDKAVAPGLQAAAAVVVGAYGVPSNTNS